MNKIKEKFAKRDKAKGKHTKAEKVKEKFVRKDENVHIDGLKRIRCPQGIAEKDVNSYFEQQKEWGHIATLADHDLHVQALQTLRAHKIGTFQNAELTILGEFVAVRFVAGKGRRKFRIERLPDKIKFQVQVENLILGFVRLLLFLSLLLETTGNVLSVASLTTGHDATQGDTGPSESSLLTFFTTLGDVFRGLLACVAAIETINSNPALFVPTYRRSRTAAGGVGGKDDVGDYGVGVWPLGGRRWLARAVMYAAVVSRGQLNSLQADRFILPDFLLQDGLVYSAWVVTVASGMSLLLHMLHVCVPSLLKSPWASVALPAAPQPSATPRPSSSREPARHTHAPDVNTKIGAFENIEHTSISDKEALDVKKEVSSDRRCCCPVSINFQRRPCTVSLGLNSIGFFLCAATAMTLFACHLARLVHTFDLQATFDPVRMLPSSFSPMLLCGAVCVAQVIGFLQTLVKRSFGTKVTLRASILLNVVSVSTLWSRGVVTWLTETHSLTDDQVDVVMTAGSVTSLVAPLILVGVGQVLSCRRQWGQGRRACVRCRLMRVEHVQSAVFMVAVLLGVSGMAMAVLSLSLPVVRVQSEYVDALKDAVADLGRVHAKAEAHYNRMLELFQIDICGGPDVQQLKREMQTARQAAATLTVAQLRDHCDQLGVKKSVQREDPFCERYGAARLLFAGQMAVNTTLHDRGTRQARTANKTVQNKDLNRIIVLSRAQQLQTLDEGDTELTPGAYQVYDKCLIGLCIAENAALIAMLIPFAGIAFKLVYLGLVAVETVVRLLIKLSKLQTLFLDFKLSLEILMAKFNFYKEEKILQFSLTNFNLIYLAYPAILTGCLGILAGFWYRRGAAVSHRRRAALVVVLPLVVFNLFGLGMTLAWAQIVGVLGEVAPMISMTVTPLSALMVLRIAYILTLLSCLLFLLLAFFHHWLARRTLRSLDAAALSSSENSTLEDKPQATKTNSWNYRYKKVQQSSTSISQDTELTVFIQREERQTTETHSSTLGASLRAGGKAEKRGEKSEESEKALMQHSPGANNNNKVKVTQGVAPGSTSWILAMLLSLGSACAVSVIIWKPVFAFDFDFNADMRHILKRVEQRVYSTEAARDSLYDDDGARCNLVDFIAKLAMERYMTALRDMILHSFKQILNTVDIKVQVTALPSLQLIQIPLLLAVYVPFLIITWAVVSAKLRPAWSPSPRACARLTNSMAWLSLGWLVNGVLFLTTVAQAGVLPIFRIHVYTGEGFAYAMAANVGLLMVAQELRIGSISPLL